MGIWGAGLYSGDSASDLKSTIHVLAKIPINGDEILEILKTNSDETFDINENGGPATWLVIADQFKKKGIDCAEVFETARMIIKKDLDINDCITRGAENGYINERRRILNDLLEKIDSHGLVQTRTISSKRPPMPLNLGDVFTFPTMDGSGCNPWFTKKLIDLKFHSNGWGAVAILSIGYLFDWIPWCAYVSLNVKVDKIPTIEDTLKSKILDPDGAEICIPRQNHMKKIRMEYIGQLPIDSDKGYSAIRKGRKAIHAILADWSFNVYNAKSNNGFLPIMKLCK